MVGGLIPLSALILSPGAGFRAFGRRFAKLHTPKGRKAKAPVLVG